MYKRLISAVIILFLALQIASCGTPKDNTGDNSGDYTLPTTNNIDGGDIPTTEEPVIEISDNVPDYDFEQYEFTILNTPQENLHYMNLFMEAEEETGEPINDEGYRRSRELEERFNITIKEIKVNSVMSTFRKAVLSGDDMYDIGMINAPDALTLAGSNIIASIEELPNIDLTMPWWDQNAKASYSVANETYFTPGAYELSNMDMTRILMFNKQMMQDYGINEDVYDLVLSGNWTYEKFFQMSKVASKDLNGDGTYDYQDLYGAGSTADHVVFGSFLSGSGEMLVKKDSEDIPYFAAGSERFNTVIQSMVENFYDGNFYFYPKNGPNAEEWCTNMFNESRMLFYVITFNRIPKFRSMDADFGILPLPKFDASQEDYYCESGGGMVGVIPQTVSDPERTGAIWEAYCALSYKYVVPAYKEVSLKTKFARDDQSAAMVDIIYNGRIYDLGRQYWAGKVFDPYVALMTNKSTDVVSVTDKITASAEAAITKSINALFD